MSSFTQLCDEFIQYDLQSSPEFATWAGVHDYDGELTDQSPQAHAERMRKTREYLSRLDAIDSATLDESARLDHGLLRSTLAGRLVDGEQMRMAERTPDPVLDEFCWGLFALMKRNFASIEERLRNAISRLEKCESVFQSARERLTNPSTIPVAISVSSLKDTIPFFTDSLPLAFQSVEDPVLRVKFNDLCAKAAEEYRRFSVWLEEQKTDPHFAIGEAAYTASLRDAECVNLSVSDILAAGERELERLTEAFRETAKQVDSTKSAAEVFDEISLDHPTPDQLIPFTASMLEDLRSFCVQHDIVTFPNENRCSVEPTPEFSRELTFASMDTPGPLETNSKEAFYNVTTALPEWDAETTEQHMRSYNRYSLTSTSIHEAYPGHYTQFLWQHRWPTTVRKLYGSYSGVEGWAHYVEELMVNLGYMNNDPKLRLGQLQEALLRAVRLVVGIGMHTGDMTLDQGIALFEEKALLERVNAEREARRGTTDPMYSNYTLGKLMLKKLKSDYQEKFPDRSLRQFHDDFLAEGYPPIPLVRQRLLGSVGGIL